MDTNADLTEAAEDITYQFDCNGRLWAEWKRGVDRETSLDDRLRMLIKADRDGKVDLDDA